VRLILALALALTTSAYAQPVIHTSCARELSEHERTLHAELSRSLDDTSAELDASLVSITETLVGTDIEVRAEIRALVSDAHGAVRWTSTAHAKVRGSLRERLQLRRDAVIEATHALAATIRKRL
jgi:hypothetical protein